jgi:RimJ/RimL family protein N-acetyltransferase
MSAERGLDHGEGVSVDTPDGGGRSARRAVCGVRELHATQDHAIDRAVRSGSGDIGTPAAADRGQDVGTGIVASPDAGESLIPDQAEPAWHTGALPRGFGLRLRYPSVHDVRAYVSVRRASRGFHLAWEPRRKYDPTGPEAFRRLIAQHNTAGSQRLFVWLDDERAATGELAAHARPPAVDDGQRWPAILGQVSLSLVQPGPSRTAYAGYWVAAACARRGVGSRAVALALDHAFGAMHLHRVEANVQPDNLASIKLVETLGFRDEGLCRKYLEINGEWRDHVRYSMLAEEWPAKRATFAERTRQP